MEEIKKLKRIIEEMANTLYLADLNNDLGETPEEIIKTFERKASLS